MVICLRDVYCYRQEDVQIARVWCRWSTPADGISTSTTDYLQKVAGSMEVVLGAELNARIWTYGCHKYVMVQVVPHQVR